MSGRPGRRRVRAFARCAIIERANARMPPSDSRAKSDSMSTARSNAIHPLFMPPRKLITQVNHAVVDDVNALEATRTCMTESILSVRNKLSVSCHSQDADMYAMIDGNKCPNKLPIKSKPLVKGDSLCCSVALASIIAKVKRDQIMVIYVSINFTIYSLISVLFSILKLL